MYSLFGFHNRNLGHPYVLILLTRILILTFFCHHRCLLFPSVLTPAQDRLTRKSIYSQTFWDWQELGRSKHS